MHVIVVPSFTKATRDELVRNLGASTDEVLSVVLARTQDCAHVDGAGVRFVLDPARPEATPFYLDRRLPTVASSTSSTDTDLAIGGFVAVPPVSVTMHGALASTGAELFATPLLVKPGGITFVDYAARP